MEIPMKSGRSLVSLAQELERQLASKKDLVVSSSLLRHDTDDTGDTRLVIEEGSAPVSYGVTPLARRQLADKLKIPYAYFERMRTEQPVLLDRNVNTWLQSDDDRRMIRTLDGNVRAVLSDRYRRLDNFDLAESVLPILQRLPEVRFESVELTETRMYLKCVTPRLTFEMAPGDIVQAGVVITNSEVGQGTLSVQPLLYRLVCKQRADRVGPRCARRTSGARSATTTRHHRVQGRHLARRRQGLLPEGARRGSGGGGGSHLPPGRAEAAEDADIPLTGDPVKSVEVLANRYTLNDTSVPACCGT
jgi:hypothetical protein